MERYAHVTARQEHDAAGPHSLDWPAGAGMQGALGLGGHGGRQYHEDKQQGHHEQQQRPGRGVRH